MARVRLQVDEVVTEWKAIRDLGAAAIVGITVICVVAMERAEQPGDAGATVTPPMCLTPADQPEPTGKSASSGPMWLTPAWRPTNPPQLVGE